MKSSIKKVPAIELIVEKPNAEEAERISRQALLHFKNKEALIRKVVSNNVHLLKQDADQELYYCSGQLSIAFAILYNQLNIQSMSFENPCANLVFDGDGWGVGVGGGVAWFGGWFNIPPNELIGMEVDYSIEETGPGISFAFTNNGTGIGLLQATGIAVGAGIFGGSGTFRGNTC